MRRVITVAALLLAVAAPAQAADVSQPWMDQAATVEAGHTVHAWCESDRAGWNRLSATLSFRPDALGITPTIGGEIVYLSPLVCDALLRGEAEPRVFGFALYVLFHEAAHAAGVRDEVEADCWSLRWLPTQLFVTLGVPWFSELMRVTWNAAAIAAIHHPTVGLLPVSCLRVLR